MANWYCGSNKYDLVASWQPNTEYAVGALVKQATQPSDWVNRRVFRCTQAGTSGSSEPSWNLAKASTTNDNTVVWQEVTGNSAYGWSAAGPALQLFLNGTSSWAAAGDTVYVNAGHNEVHPGVYLNSPGVIENPVYVLCVDDALQPASTATITKTAGWMYVHGFAYSCGVSYANPASMLQLYGWIFEDCTLTQSDLVIYGPVTFRNVVVYQSTFYTGILLGAPGILTWRGGAIYTSGEAGRPTFVLLSGYSYERWYTRDVVVEGVDLSGYVGTNVLCAVGFPGRIMLKNCRLRPNITLVSRSARLTPWGRIELVNCDSANTNYRYYRYQDAGEIFHETGVYREGGASDGTTPICRRMVSSDWAKYEDPLILGELVGWNETTGQQKTATVHLLTNGVTLTNKDLWVEVEYLGNANHPQSLFVTNKPHILESGTSLDSDNVTWVHNLQNPVRQKVSLSFTPQMKGPIRVTVRLARPSTTVYVCPKVDIP